MRILLVVPPFLEEGLEMASKESIGVCYLASVLRAHGFGVDILDADLLDLTIGQTIDHICRIRYALIGFSVMEGTIESTVDILEGIRKRGIKAHIVLGGFFPTLIAEEILMKIRHVNSVILGEGEYTLLELAQCIQHGKEWRSIKGVAYREKDTVIVNATRNAFDLDAVPFPARDLLPEVLHRGGVIGVVGSRGCFEQCAFCCIGRFNKVSGIPAWRGRTPVNIVDEIEELVSQYGIDTISFYDSTFIGPGQAGVERAYDIAEEIRARGIHIHFAISVRTDQVEKRLFRCLKKAGLTEAFIGIETMSQPILELYNKHTTVAENMRALEILEELEISFRPGFILYEPYVTLGQIKENIRFLQKLNKSRYCNKFHFFKALRVYRGSPLEEQFIREGILIRNGWHNSYTWQEPLIEKFIYLTGIVGAKMLPLIEKTRGMEPEAKRYLDQLLGKWSLETYEEILDNIQTCEASQTEYIDIAVQAEGKLQKIQQVVNRYVQYGQNLERRVQRCSVG